MAAVGLGEGRFLPGNGKHEPCIWQESNNQSQTTSTLLRPSPWRVTRICVLMRSFSSSRCEMIPTRRLDCPAMACSFSNVDITLSKLFSSSVPNPSSMKSMLTLKSGRFSDESASDKANDTINLSPPDNTVALRTASLLYRSITRMARRSFSSLHVSL